MVYRDFSDPPAVLEVGMGFKNNKLACTAKNEFGSVTETFGVERFIVRSKRNGAFEPLDQDQLFNVTWEEEKKCTVNPLDERQRIISIG